MPVPPGTHDATGEIKLDMVNIMLHLVANGLCVTVGAVTLSSVTRGQEVATCGGQKTTASKDPRPVWTRTLKCFAPCYIYPIIRPATAHSRNTRLNHPSLQVLAKVGGDLGDSCALWNGMLRVDVTIPKPRKQVGAGQVDYLVIRRTGR